MDIEPITVLVADDEEDMRMLVRKVLARANVEVVAEAIDGTAALEELDRLDPPPVPTVLVLDNRMPGMTGLEVAEAVLHQMPDQPIVLFSAFITEDIERRATELGVRACLAKTDIGRLPSLVSELASA